MYEIRARGRGTIWPSGPCQKNDRIIILRAYRVGIGSTTTRWLPTTTRILVLMRTCKMVDLQSTLSPFFGLRRLVGILNPS